jgi:hypothetical protein
MQITTKFYPKTDVRQTRQNSTLQTQLNVKEQVKILFPSDRIQFLGESEKPCKLASCKTVLSAVQRQYLDTGFVALGFSEQKQKQALEKLLELMGCFQDLQASSQAVFSSPKEAIEWINSSLQKSCLRKQGTERSQMKTPKPIENKRLCFVQILQNLGHINEVKHPENKEPDCVLLLGAFQEGFTERLNTLTAYLENDVLKCRKLYLLGSKRPLWPYVQYKNKDGELVVSGEPVTAKLVARRLQQHVERNPEDKLAQKNVIPTEDTVAKCFKNSLSPEALGHNTYSEKYASIFARKEFKDIVWPTEMDMMVEVFNETQKKHSILQDMEVIAVNSRNKPNGSRANTQDTFVAWYNQHGKNLALHQPHRVTVISSQPHIPYQQAIGKITLPMIHMETLGSRGLSREVNIPVALDALARRIYALKEKACNA